MLKYSMIIKFYSFKLARMITKISIHVLELCERERRGGGFIMVLGKGSTRINGVDDSTLITIFKMFRAKISCYQREEHIYPSISITASPNSLYGFESLLSLTNFSVLKIRCTYTMDNIFSISFNQHITKSGIL